MEFEPDDSLEVKLQAQHDIIENERKLNCERAMKKSTKRNQNVLRLENEFYLENVQNKKDISAEGRLKLEQEENLSKELNRIRREEISNLKMRQHLRETCQELRELESKLRTAYVSKELAAQMAEKEYLKLDQKMNDKMTDIMVANALSDNAKVERLRAEAEIKKKVKYKEELHDQMIMNYQEKQYEYEEFLKEKKIVDEIIQRIHEEDMMEMEAKMLQMRKTKAEIDAFKTAQEIWKQKERRELEEENRRIFQFLQQKEADQKAKEKHKMDEEAARDKMIEEMTKKMYSKQMKQKERDEILQELLIEEIREKEEQEVKQKLEQTIRLRIETQNSLARQLEEREDKIRQEELEDANYKQQLLDKILEDDKLEQMSAEKRRRKMIEYRRSIEDTIKDRRAKRTEELRELLFIQEQQKIHIENRKKIIEDERIRLLKEHAANLIGYLPPGILRAEDLPHLGSEFVNRYSKK